MSEVTHITLAARGYSIIPERRRKALANPFTARVSTGSSSYEELDDWQAWVLDTWGMGVGQTDPSAGGFLFANGVDTRFRNKLILGPMVTPVMSQPLTAVQSVSFIRNVVKAQTIGDGYTYSMVAMPVRAGSPWSELWVYLSAPLGAKITVSVIANDLVNAAPMPMTGANILATATITADYPRPGWHWYPVALGKSVSSGDQVWIVVDPTEGAEATIPLEAGAAPNVKYLAKVSGVDTWVGGGEALRMGVILNTPALALPPVGFHRLADITYHVSGSKIYTEAPGPYWKELIDVGATVTDSETYTANLYLTLARAEAQTQSIQYDPESNTWSTFTPAPGTPIHHLARWNGYLYGVGGDGFIYYYVAGISSSSQKGVGRWGPLDDGGKIKPVETSDGAYLTTGVCGLPGGNDVAVATEEGLFILVNGDVISAQTAWGSIHPNNGRGMVAYQNDLYIPADHRVWRFVRTQGGSSMMDIWIDPSEELPPGYIGTVAQLAAINSMLIAAVDGKLGATVWGYTGEGWHNLVTLPEGFQMGPVDYDRDTNRLWIATQQGIVFYVTMPDASLNPLRDTNYRYAASGWVEFPPFYGRLNELSKDIQSVYIIGHNITVNTPVDIYWRDDDNPDAWQYLGRVTQDKQEIEWEVDHNPRRKTNRPNTKEFRLGVLLHTTDPSQTPVINAIRVKYHTNVNDRYTWALMVECTDRTETIGGERIKYTAQEQRDHLAAVVRSVPPVWFTDIDGREYLVKVTAESEMSTQLTYFDGGIHYDSLHAITLVQV